MEVCCTASCFGSPSSRGRQAQARRQQQNSCLATARDIIIRLAANCFARESPSSRRRQINPPEIADSQHGSPAERYDQGRLVEKRWGTSSNTNERPRARHCTSNIHLSSSSPSSYTHTLTHSPYQLHQQHHRLGIQPRGKSNISPAPPASSPHDLFSARAA